MFRKSLRLAVALAFTVLTIGIIACSESGRLSSPIRCWMKTGEDLTSLPSTTRFLNPDAGKNLEPVTGMDAVASENTVNKYDKSFTEKKDKEVTNILKLQ